jgi:hypothetical protein
MVTLRVHVEHLGELIGPSESVGFDLYRNERYMATIAATPAGKGEYIADHAFGQPGTWRVEPFISSQRPSPHASFEIVVAKVGIAGVPGFELPMVLAAVAAASVVASRSYKRTAANHY